MPPSSLFSASSGRPSPSTRSSAVRYRPLPRSDSYYDDGGDELDSMTDPDNHVAMAPAPRAGASYADEDTGKPAVDVIEHAPPAREADGGDRHHHRLDAAAELLRKTRKTSTDGARIVVTPADDQRVLRRIDLVILPIILTVYFLQALDKATLAYASVFGLIDDTGLRGDQYSWLGSIVYLAQLVMQPALAWLLVKLPIGKFTSATVLCWGVTLACMAAAGSFRSLLATRFLLGAFEAGVAPSFIAVTQMWWRRREQTVRVSYWYAMNGIEYALRSYQIIFLFFGVITVAFSFVMFVFMPDSPVEAKFLNDADKLIAIERLRMNQMGVMSREWRWDHFRESMYDLKTWCWFALLFSISIPSGGISTFGPLIVQSFGFDSFQTILFNIPFGFVQLVATVGGAFLATHLKRKGPVIAMLCLPPIVGCVVLMVLPHSATHRAGLLVGYYLISVYPGITPLIYSWSAQNTAGDTKRKCTTAALFIGQSVGNVVGPQLYTTAEAPAYSRGLRSNLALYVAIVVLVGITTAYLAGLNRAHAKRRVAMGKSAVIIDTSLYSAEEADQMRAATAGAVAEGADAQPSSSRQLGERAFENLTDLENEEFVFVY